LRDWLDRGLEPAQITILSPRAYEQSLVGTIDSARLPRQIVDVSKADTLDGSRIRFSTIAGFKGLEADAILLVDIEDMTSPDQLALLYTGATRATSLLGLVMDERCREMYGERVTEIVGRLIEAPRS
jgi:superfamily I DNA/RNA helicase